MTPKRDDEHTTTEAHEIPTDQVADDVRTGGDVLVAAMRAAGVDMAFGVISIHNLPLVEAVDRDLRFVPVRHEAAAINAADSYARATGRIGVALTSTGTGAGNAAGAMLEALTTGSRVLHVTGNIDSAQLGKDRGVYHEVPRQLEMLGTVSRHALRVDAARRSERTLAEAVRLLDAAPTGPVSIDWPIDLQYTADPDKQARVPKTLRTDPEPQAATKREIAKAARVLRRAKRPLIWAGGGTRALASTAEGQRALVELAERWGAGVLTGAAGRGAVPEDHPLLIGNFAVADELAELVRDTDCLLTLGSHLRANETKTFELPLPGTHVQVDVDPEAPGRTYPVTEGIVADVRAVVPALLEELGKVRTEAGWGERVRAAADAARAAHRAEIGAYAGICDAMRRRLPREAVVVRDVTIPGSSWGNRLLDVYRPTENVFAAGGGIGQGLAMAVGAGVARPGTPVLAIVGDGGLAVYLGELATLAAERPDVVLTVFNDGGYGVLRHMQEAKDQPHRGVDLLTPDLGGLARAFGLPHERVGDAAGFDAALERALGRGGPALIEVDVPALEPQPARFVPPVDVP